MTNQNVLSSLGVGLIHAFPNSSNSPHLNPCFLTYSDPLEDHEIHGQAPISVEGGRITNFEGDSVHARFLP